MIRRKLFLILLLTGILWLYVFPPGCTDQAVAPPPEGSTPAELTMDIVGYLPDYRVASVNSGVSRMLTHLIYFSIEPQADGNLDLTRFDMMSQSYLNALKRDNPAVKMIIAVGGWGRSRYFPDVTLNDILRNYFIVELLSFCKVNNFDGIDLDWEFPANSSEQEAYATLISQLGDSCAVHDLSLSVALNAYQTLATEAYSHLDRVHIMSYDHSGRHATFEQALNDVAVFLGRGIPSEKLYLGMPFYGRKITDFSQVLGYRDIVSRYHPSENVDEVDGYYFNNIGTVIRKSEYAIAADLGGVMVWEIGQDTDGEESLLRAIFQTASGDSLLKIFKNELGK